jgi:hypothetical protein
MLEIYGIDYSEVNEFRGIYHGIRKVCCIGGGTPEPPAFTEEKKAVQATMDERERDISNIYTKLVSERHALGVYGDSEQLEYIDKWIDWLGTYKPAKPSGLYVSLGANYGGAQYRGKEILKDYEDNASQWKGYADKIVQEVEAMKPPVAPPKVSSVKVDQTSTMYKSQYGQVPMATKKTAQRGSTPYYQSEKKTPKSSQSQSLYTRMKTGKL